VGPFVDIGAVHHLETRVRVEMARVSVVGRSSMRVT
jgi:hypothetical protein